jgi:predicted glycoside hydrolase/deacetylase ChbG (UPF0249 family)
VLLVAAVCSATVAAPASNTTNSGRKMYKWIDEQGLTHYGDRIPPEYASQEQHIINAAGIEVQHIDAQKSAEQLAEEDQRRVEAAQRAVRDKNLLTTYGSVQEIERLRDQRLNLITDQIKVKSQFLEALNGQLEKLRLSSMRFKPYSTDPHAPPMTDQLAEDLVRVTSDKRTQEENLREKRSEETAMRKGFEDDIARFKELKGIH